MKSKRYNDLDALRGFAMLLGIVLHSMMYLGGKGLYGGTMSFIHGFRMQLFFLVSGFFVVMLWRNKGLKALLKHRAKRLLLPIVVFIPLLVISTLWLLGLTEAWKNSDFLTNAVSNRIYISGDNLFSATRSGDLEAIKKHLDNGSDIQKGFFEADPCTLGGYQWPNKCSQTAHRERGRY